MVLTSRLAPPRVSRLAARAASLRHASRRTWMGARLPYEHGFHAGNFADAMKHTVLLLLLQRMCDKESPFVYVDTHAGAGRYDLGGDEALRLGESTDGIDLLRSAADRMGSAALPMPVRRLIELDAQAAGFYPGSPLLAAESLRPQDSMLLCELAPDQYSRLLSCPPIPSMVADGRAKVLCRDGYKTLSSKDKNVLTTQKRALVLVDPPYQMGSDTERTAALVLHLATHWRSARVAVWYPMRDRAKTRRLYEQLSRLDLGGKAILAAELTRAEDGGGDGRLPGTGMILVDPHFGVDAELETLLGALGECLHAEPRVEWLVR